MKVIKLLKSGEINNDIILKISEKITYAILA